MRYCLYYVFATACLLLAALPTQARGNPDVLCANLLESPRVCALNKAFAGFWLNRDLAEANARLEAAWAEALGDAAELTPALADEKFKWQMRTWVRLYYLFGTDSARFPGRLSPENTARIESLLWNYACAKSALARADLKYVWFIQGSENHDMMDLGNAFLAVQALAEHPDYAPRTLPDGGIPRQHADAWTAYFTRYCSERFRLGGLIEFASPTYGKYFIPELVNLFDFAVDATLRNRAGSLLHLIWAGWAVEQLNGIGGGAKARCYQGDYAQHGGRDAWYLMGQLLLGTGEWADANRYNHPILGFGPVLATSAYTLPEVIADLALHPEQRGEYASVSTRPARMAHVDPLPPFGDHSCWYHPAHEDPRFLRYSWCTPDYILGSYTFDPALRADFQIYPDEPDRAGGRYAAISAQNLWQGVIFNTGPEARIFPQCVGKPDKHKPGVSVTYLQQIAIQHENVLLIQSNRAQPDITAMEVYFGPGMKERLVERDGWRILEEGNSFAAVKLFSRDDPAQAGGAAWRDDNFLRADDRYAPVVLVAGRKAQFADLDAIAAWLVRYPHQIEGGKFTYTFPDRAGVPVSLALYLDESRLPERNGVPVNVAPEAPCESPFLHADRDAGGISIQFNGKRLDLRMAE